MQFVKSAEYIEQLQTAIENADKTAVIALTQDLHPADIADIFDDLNIEEAKFTF